MRNWTLNKLIVLVLAGGFLVLMFDIRAEHQDVLGNHQIAWAPIVYSGLMIILCLLGLAFWESWGRKILLWAFAAALLVGAIGFWQHNEENFSQRIAYTFTVWGNSTEKHHHGEQTAEANQKPAAENQNSDENSGTEPKPKGGHELRAPVIPPILAPLAFAGLGLLGIFACADRFRRES